MGNNKFTADDLHSGFVVEFRNGRRAIVARAGSFTKILVDPTCRRWWYLSSGWCRDTLLARDAFPTNLSQSGRSGATTGWDICKVFGLVNTADDYAYCIDTTSNVNRKKIWDRTPPVRLTIEEISKRLGYEIEIVGDED